MGLFRKIKDKLLGQSNRQKTKYQATFGRNGVSLGQRFSQLAARYRKVNEEYFEELIAIMIEADIAVDLTYEIVEAVEKECRLDDISDPQAINELVVDKIFISYAKDQVLESGIRLQPGLTVVLVVGVNGVGKTTTIAKIANYYKKEGKKVMVAAADTFRAAAVEQLQVWADRLDITLVKKEDGADPASVIFDAIKKAKEDNIDLLICDSAGRMQTKSGLMQELSKMARIISREVPGGPHEVLLVIDATTGQNGVVQAQAFAQATPVTGLVLTKMDGTAKGGIVLAIKDKFDIPVRFIGVGESVEDLIEFDLEEYLVSLFSEG